MAAAKLRLFRCSECEQWHAIFRCPICGRETRPTNVADIWADAQPEDTASGAEEFVVGQVVGCRWCSWEGEVEEFRGLDRRGGMTFLVEDELDSYGGQLCV
jgi:hypothetical protein